MIPGIAPAISKKKAAAGGGYSFTMTAGNYNNIIFGYGPGFGIGTINAEPIPEHTLSAIISGAAGNMIVFEGNCLALVAGKTVWVGGVSYPFDGQDWSYGPHGAFGDSTAGFWDSAGPTFVDQGVYFVEIK